MTSNPHNSSLLTLDGADESHGFARQASRMALLVYIYISFILS